eukprot:TRINITY_DN7922_c1_g1_i1.p1 TRINITY_DN7922_c1_g1~~TRINITY_DN7922_c1_g1_i1.p1  ORF type:complete len:330 (-),score=77.12 TRINITY_DN7922_c1_g1_i1:375-1241(-)
MNTIMAKTPYDSSFSSSKRNFQWTNTTQQQQPPPPQQQQHKEAGQEKESLAAALSSSSFTSTCGEGEEKKKKEGEPTTGSPPIEAPSAPGSSSSKKKPGAAAAMAVMRLRSVLTAIAKTRWHAGLGSKVTVTLFGYRRGHVHFAFQEDPKASPALLIELATPTNGLVREMASGLVRIALECDKKTEKRDGVRLLEEPLWRTYCNGRKCGFAMRRECGASELKILKAVEPISMGAGVLPGNGAGSEGELMYMRAKFDRVVGSRDSEAFYMMNPEPGSGGPELSIYLLRV